MLLLDRELTPYCLRYRNYSDNFQRHSFPRFFYISLLLKTVISNLSVPAFGHIECFYIVRTYSIFNFLRQSFLPILRIKG